MAGRVCILSPGSLASNPRVLKEAGALHDAGYEVTTVVCDYSVALRDADDELVAKVPWTVVRVPRPATERYVAVAARIAARTMNSMGIAPPLAIAASAYDGPAAALRAAAGEVSADLYIAHYVVALPAAAAAAHRHRGLLAFDAEDFHSGEGGGGSNADFRMALVRRIEGAVLPSCSYATAASPLIGKAYEKIYGLHPITVLNVFPLVMAPKQPASSNGDSLRAYWFSQTVGLDRGLQAFIRGMALARSKVTLDIRGSDRWGHGRQLTALARELGLEDRVTLLPLAAPDDMARLAASYDLGLSLETDVSESRRLCLTNKIFTYLLAGTPVMMSDTPAQAALAPELGPAASLVSLSDPKGIAQALDRVAVPDTLADARATAWRLGHERYNWDREKVVLIEAVAAAFRRSAAETRA